METTRTRITAIGGRRHTLRLLLALCALTIAAPAAHAENYLTGYSYGNGSYHFWRGYNSHYVGSYLSSGSIDRPHKAEYRRLAKERAEQAAKTKWYNSNPPCGVYGRVPERCKKMESRW